MPATNIADYTRIVLSNTALIDSLTAHEGSALIQARIDFCLSYAHIKESIRQTLTDTDSLSPRTTRWLANTESIDHGVEYLMSRLSHSDPNSYIDMSNLAMDIHQFRLYLSRFQVPISDTAELALTDLLTNGLRIVQEDNRLLQQITNAYDNNPNYRHEVGRLTAIREVALSGSITTENIGIVRQRPSMQ